MTRECRRQVREKGKGNAEKVNDDVPKYTLVWSGNGKTRIVGGIEGSSWREAENPALPSLQLQS